MLKLIFEDCFKVKRLNIYEFSLKKLSYILQYNYISFYILTIISLLKH